MASIEDQIMLLKQSLYELADNIGDSQLDPLSFSLLCLEFDISWDAQSKILALFEELSHADYSDMESKEVLSAFRNRLSEVAPQAEEFSDLTVYSFLRAVSKRYVEDLYPLSCYLQEEFTLIPDLE